jgi:hypothetical protein
MRILKDPHSFELLDPDPDFIIAAKLKKISE